ncbi:hypothetical protein BLNAU_21090 [Blattamonas nauphoetae]|uniref:Ubiquitin-like domain-containing protein n=1 Tax=Blattamonas nauphoetae TaxID=2049346 RepID=A0ABQ9WWU9_9EUKA|nr:hypothetical protein BLNAU_21090 [Blattamonas nauphoetae]
MIGFSLAGPGTSIRIDAFKSHIKPLQDIASLADISQTILNFPNTPFDLLVMNAFTGEEFTLNVHPNTTILQIKQSLVPRLSRSIENIGLIFEADTLDDSTNLSEIAFDDRCALIAFINDPDDSTTITVHHNNSEDQPLTALPSKEISDDVFDLIVKGPSSGEEYTFNVHPQNTILQIKQSLVPQLNISIKDISLLFEADELDDSITLSEIDFNGHYAIVAFVNEPDDALTVKAPSKENTEEQPSTQSPLKETIDEMFDLIVKCPFTGEEFALNVHPGHTILQIKQLLVPQLNVPFEDISFFHKADKLTDSTWVNADLQIGLGADLKHFIFHWPALNYDKDKHPLYGGLLPDLNALHVETSITNSSFTRMNDDKQTLAWKSYCHDMIFPSGGEGGGLALQNDKNTTVVSCRFTKNKAKYRAASIMLMEQAPDT